MLIWNNVNNIVDFNIELLSINVHLCKFCVIFVINFMQVLT